MRAPRTYRRSAGGGSDRFVLGTALLVPLAVVLLLLTQLRATGLAAPSLLNHADAAAGIPSKRPVSSNPAPPPTLEPPTATPRPTATPVPASPALGAAATPRKGGTYVVQPGDELKQIAADYHVSIWKIIAANDIPNPDSLKVGQELR